MNSLPDGRHYIPLSNSKSQCLLENWVEERAVRELDAQKAQRKPNVTNTAILLKDGHDGLLTTAYCSQTDDLTTHVDSYQPIRGPTVRTLGSRAEVLHAMLYEKARNELEEEARREELERSGGNEIGTNEGLRSVTRKDFGIDDFVSQELAPTAHHTYAHEQPITFWTEMRDRAHGVSQSQPSSNSPFRRNTAFTRPIGESWEPEHVKPYEANHVPNM